MSSHDRSARVSRRALLALAGVALLAGCSNVRPLYGTVDLSSPTGERSSDAFKRIEVGRIGGDVGFELRRELIFGFHGGAEHEGEDYMLTVTVATNNLRTTTLPTNNASPAPMFVQVAADFTLVDKKTREVLYTGASFANASFDQNTQQFSNLRATRDAQQRAGRLVARDIHTKIAAYFATAHKQRG
jgi:LPS-assembly lipoprotein